MNLGDKIMMSQKCIETLIYLNCRVKNKIEVLEKNIQNEKKEKEKFEKEIMVNIRVRYCAINGLEKEEKVFKRIPLKEGKRKALNFCKLKQLSLDDYSITIFDETWKFIEKYTGNLGEKKFSSGRHAEKLSFQDSSSFLKIRSKGQRTIYRGYK